MYILTLNGGYIKPLKLQNIGKYTALMIGVFTHLIYLQLYAKMGYNGIGALLFRSPGYYFKFVYTFNNGKATTVLPVHMY